MTTAHRATWKAARGGLQEEGSFQLHVPSAAVSSKDAPTERLLKLRADDDLSRGELRARLDSENGDGHERRAKRARTRFSSAVEAAPGTDPRLLLTEGAEHPAKDGVKLDARAQGPDTGAPCSGGDDDEIQRSNPEVVELGNNADKLKDSKEDKRKDGEDGDEEDDKNAESESESDSDSSDDEAELIAEMERIRKEREFARAKKQAEEQERLQREEDNRVANGNPLLGPLGASSFQDEISETASIATGSVAFSVRRRWDDDVVFRNQARRERANAPRMINDTIRNDFHRRFMKRYMR